MLVLHKPAAQVKAIAYEVTTWQAPANSTDPVAGYNAYRDQWKCGISADQHFRNRVNGLRYWNHQTFCFSGFAADASRPSHRQIYSMKGFTVKNSDLIPVFLSRRIGSVVALPRCSLRLRASNQVTWLMAVCPSGQTRTAFSYIVSRATQFDSHDLPSGIGVPATTRRAPLNSPRRRQREL